MYHKYAICGPSAERNEGDGVSLFWMRNMVISRKGDLVLKREQEEQIEKMVNHSNK